MIRVAKPRNARSKRALEKRESKDYENAKTALFVRGPHSSDKVSLALREFASLKKPHAVPFNKQNDVVPFEDAASIEFWGKKNDASLFLLANHQKKRPHNLTWVRLFDGQVLDMYEMGIINGKGHETFKSKHSPLVGARPLFHFSGPHFSSDIESASALSLSSSGLAASMQHIKSLFLDFYRGEEMPPGSGPGSIPGQNGMQVALKDGLQHLITIVEGPVASDDEASQPTTNGNADLEALYKAGAVQMDAGGSSMVDTSAQGRMLHLRTYAIVSSSPSSASASAAGASSSVELEELGPSFDFVLRRRQMPALDRLNASLKRPKTQAEKNRQGKGGAKKNIETDDMGDTVGRVHVGKQDLSKLQTRKMKALKRTRGGAVAASGSDNDDDDDEAEDLGDDDAELVYSEDEGDDGSHDDDDDDIISAEGSEEEPSSKRKRA